VLRVPGSRVYPGSDPGMIVPEFREWCEKYRAAETMQIGLGLLNSEFLKYQVEKQSLDLIEDYFKSKKI
jgi:hypothetical protein